jgi:hypothetical protein
MFRTGCSLLFAATAFALGANAASAQQRVVHLEGCMPAEKNPDFVRFKNGCNQPVSLIFWRYSLTKAVQRTVAPGETVVEQLDNGWWMSSACPVGYDPDPPFALESSKAIVESVYDCVSKQISLLQ